MVEDFSFSANTYAPRSCCFYWWAYCRRKIKLAAVSLLLNATREYSGYLLKNGGIEHRRNHGVSDVVGTR